MRCVLSHTLSTGRLAVPVAQDAGGNELGSASGAKLTLENVCNSRIRNMDTSLYANYRSALAPTHRGHLWTWEWTHLLSKTYPRPSIEGEEDKWVWQKVPP